MVQNPNYTLKAATHKDMLFIVKYQPLNDSVQFLQHCSLNNAKQRSIAICHLSMLVL